MRYLILGVTEARDEKGDDLPLGGLRLRALLASLALRPGRSVPITELVDDVWADGPPADAPAALQALVGRLRRALGRDALASTPGGYRLAATPADVDLHVFERLARQGAAELAADAPQDAARTLRTALALWRGPALADLPDRDHGHALRPEAHRLAALEHRIEADLRCAAADGPRGPMAALVPELVELTAAHPYDERFRAQLIRALRAAGRQAEALAAYEDARRALAEGLGTDPGPELAALHRTLLNPEPLASSGPLVSSGPPASSASSGPLVASGSPTPSASSGPLVSSGPPAPSASSASSEPSTSSGSPASSAPSAPSAPGTEAPEPRGNLRPRLTSFVGREPELRAIRDDLTRSRLVTLTGPGGSGKTRLAEESAAHGGRAAGDVWLAELAPVEDPAAVPGAVLSALGLRETALLRDTGHEGTHPRTDPVELLADHLAHWSRSRPFLLILDNCEHVIGAAATLAETLLTRCPRLRILATSREPLGVPGESVRPVDPLPADLAHRLFTERARAVRPGFDPGRESAHDAAAVAEICRRLDGLPLAIELAAARLRMLSPRQIADRLDDRFRLLTSGSRTVLPRQQTLRAVVDWSWDLLDEDERTALRQVSVFAGGWDLPAAEAVITMPDRSAGHPAAGTADLAPDATSPAAGTADLIGALIDKSLVVATPATDGGMRYRLLETIHEYAIERCAETPGVRAEAGRAHTAYFLSFVEEAEPKLRSAEQLPWIQRLETDLDNIRAALHRTTAPAGRSGPSSGSAESDAARLVLGMGWFWWLRNYRTEGLDWTARALSFGPEPADATDPRYWPWMNLRMLRFFLEAESGPSDAGRDGQPDAALVRRLADAFMSSGPQAARFPGLLWPMTSFITLGTTDMGDVQRKIDAVVDNARVHGNDWGYGVSLMFRTHMVVDMPGGMPGVDDDLVELRELSRRVGDRWMRAQVESAAAEAAMMRGRYEEARPAYEAALLLAREVGAHAEAPFLLARLAELAYRTGDVAAAERGLDRSAAEAERYQTYDAIAYVHYLRATMALDRGDIAVARRRLTEARGTDDEKSPPTQMPALLDGLSARIAVYEPEPHGGPAFALRGLAAALVAARDGQYAESITGYLADAVATVLPKLGHHAAAVRVLAAADSWRLCGPRTAVEQAAVDEAGQLAREALGERSYERERAAGNALTIDDVAGLLAEIIGPVADDRVAGDSVVGDPAAGDPAAGDPVAGDAAAGDPAVCGPETTDLGTTGPAVSGN
ncbi:AfsR/SARP family transcriptional regulator [Streptomyces sp. NPDC092903]|uniref:AfsR/SARP family transcriptional regulator n=1 Tax=Streptomyces sp. NPDC092903 TaxID=3366017 RepID=UPI00382A6868